jgi:putative hydrolase
VFPEKTIMQNKGDVILKLLTDTHTHSLVSGHAYNSMKEMVLAAKEKGLEAIAITEHAPEMPGTCGAFYFSNYKVVPRDYYGIPMLLGVELNIMDENGTIDLADEILKGMDIVIASIHPPCYGKNKGKEANTDAYVKLMEQCPYVDIIGHPDDIRYPIDYDRLAREAAKHKVALEINATSLNPGSFRGNGVDNIREMLRCAKKYDTSISVGSDAHFENQIANFAKPLELLEEAEFPEKQVISRDRKTLMTFLKLRQQYKLSE